MKFLLPLISIILILPTLAKSEDHQTLIRLALRQSPTTTPVVYAPSTGRSNKRLTFTLNSGTLPLYNPGAHLWAVVDGHLDPWSNKPIDGRGITFGTTHACKGLGFEFFNSRGSNVNPVKPCIKLKWKPFTRYKITVSVNGDCLTATVNKRKPIRWCYPDPDPTTFGSVIGVAFDKNPSTYSLENVEQITETEKEKEPSPFWQQLTD